jgi:hypothetical protein
MKLTRWCGCAGFPQGPNAVASRLALPLLLLYAAFFAEIF